MTAIFGMDRGTGLPIDETEHLGQSVADILTTPIGSRVERREYGSLLPELIDAPIHEQTLVQLYAASATALMRWEPRLRLTRVSVDATVEPGRLVLSIEGNRVRNGQPFSLAVRVSGGRA